MPVLDPPASQQERGAAAPLELHEGIAHTRGGCPRWPRHLRLASTGRLAPGRCRATNLCSYCQRLYTVETVEALSLDALGGDAPSVWCVLTARQHLTRAEFNEAFRVVRQKLRRRGWRWEYFCQVEFQKRGALHVNLLIKVRAGGDELALLGALKREWCSHVDAELPGQWSDVIAQELGGANAVARYVSKELAHGMKQEQKPPVGWRGHRTSHSRGYFGDPMWKVRERARASLQRKRELHKAEAAGASPAEAEAIADVQTARARRRRWELVAVACNEHGELVRVRAADGKDVREAMRATRASDHFRVADALWWARQLWEPQAVPLSGRDPVPPPEALFTLPRRE